MNKQLRSFAKRSVDGVLDAFLSPSMRLRLGRYILQRELGEGIGDPAMNGEHRVLRRVRDRLRSRRAVVFDVGANVGAWAIEFARVLGPEARLFTFEPVPAIFDQLTRQLEAARLEARVTAVCAALSDDDLPARMYLAGGLAETSSLVHRASVTESGELTVQRYRGDRFCQIHDIGTIDFVKIDVEGHEMGVLRGFERMLDERRIGGIQFEYGSTWIDSRQFLRDAFDFLCPRGYCIAKILPGGVMPIPEYVRSLDSFQYSNYLALSPDWRDLCDEPRT